MFRPYLLFLAAALPFSAYAQDRVFAEGSEWEVVSEGHEFAEGMAWDTEGHFFFTDVPRKQLFRIDAKTGEKTLFDGDTGKANGIALAPDGYLYGCASGDRGIHRWNPKTGERTTIKTDTRSNDIAILKDGTIFYTDPHSQLIWRLEAGSHELSKAATLPWHPNGITLSKDQRTLLVAEFFTDTIHGFPIGKDSKLSGSSFPAYKVATPSDGVGTLDGMLPLADGRLLSGTALGAQIVPPVHLGAGANAAHIVIPSPEGRPRCNYVRISPDKQWLYTAYREDLLRRRIVENFGQP
ncbi:MAG: SMP-30/gluconolactonase/LRE family protein [Coraliomargarita sp.]